MYSYSKTIKVNLLYVVWQAFVSCAVGTGSVGFVMMTFGLADAIGCVLTGYLAKVRFWSDCRYVILTAFNSSLMDIGLSIEQRFRPTGQM